MSATMTVPLTSFLSVPGDQLNPSKVARFGDDLCKLFQVLLVFLVKAVCDSTIDIDNGNNLDGSLQSASILRNFTDSSLPQPRKLDHIIEDKETQSKKLTFPSCKIGTTISEALAASQAMCPGNSSTSATNWVVFVVTAVPQTPLPNLMVWQATLPWKGPRISWVDGEVGSIT
jgi:hypothetical protein